MSATVDLQHIAQPLRGLAIPVADLHQDPANARTHPERNLSAVAASLRLYGQRKPVVVRREGMVVEAGNGTLVAARRLGWTHLAAVVVDDDPLTATGYAIADNRTGELAEWDDEVLGRLLTDLREEVDLPGLGWGEGELEDLLQGLQELAPPTEVPTAEPEEEESPEPVSKRGEVYELGPHRLMCGDSTDAGDVSRLLGGDRPGAWILDPPFDLSYDAWTIPDDVRLLMVWARGATGLRWVGERVGDPPLWGVATLAFSGQARGWARPEWPCCVHEVVYVLRRGAERGLRIDGVACERHDLRITEDRRPFSFYPGLASRRNDMSWAKNPACYAPWLCMVRAGEGVYDPCAGSGSSLLATARGTEERWRGMELQPRWADMIRREWGEYARRAGLPPGEGAL